MPWGFTIAFLLLCRLCSVDCVYEMAGRFKYKLPPLWVTMRSTSGKVSDRYIPRGSKSRHQPEQQMVMKEEQPVVMKEEQPVVMSSRW